MVLAKSSNLASLSRSQLSANSRRTAVTLYTRNKTILKAVPNLQKVGNKDHNNKDPVLVWVVQMSILLAHEEVGDMAPAPGWSHNHIIWSKGISVFKLQVLNVMFDLNYRCNTEN